MCPIQNQHYFRNSFLDLFLVSILVFVRFPYLAVPVSAAPQHKEVMMRNGVTPLVVKPQAAQQMCFRDLAFVSEWIRALLC